MDDKAKKQEEAKEEFGNSGLTISDILQSIDEAVKAIERTVFEKQTCDPSKR